MMARLRKELHKEIMRRYSTSYLENLWIDIQYIDGQMRHDYHEYTVQKVIQISEI